MTQHEMAVTAGARLQYWWELHGVGANPTQAIRSIAGEVALKPQVRLDVEAHLHDEWVRLCAQEGEENE